MGSITNLVPIRVDASSTNGTVHVIDTLLIDTTCLPISYSPLISNNSTAEYSIHSLVDANAAHLAESIIADAEVYGAVKSSKNHMGRLDLLSDKQLYQTVEEQIRKQLLVALAADKTTLLSRADVKAENQNNVIHIRIRLRHDNIAITDEFDYDMNISGLDGFDPFTISRNVAEDLKLPSECVISIATSILEQMYSLNLPDSAEGPHGKVPAAFIVDVKKEGSAKDIVKKVLNKS